MSYGQGIFTIHFSRYDSSQHCNMATTHLMSPYSEKEVKTLVAVFLFRKMEIDSFLDNFIRDWQYCDATTPVKMHFFYIPTCYDSNFSPFFHHTARHRAGLHPYVMESEYTINTRADCYQFFWLTLFITFQSISGVVQKRGISFL